MPGAVFILYALFCPAAGPQSACFFKIHFPVGSMWNEDFNPMLCIPMIQGDLRILSAEEEKNMVVETENIDRNPRSS